MVMDSFSSTRITTPRFRCFDPATSTSSSSPSNSNSVVRRPLWELQALISVRLSPETMVTFSKMFLTCPTTSPTSLCNARIVGGIDCSDLISSCDFFYH
ncbi:hypothetical protein CsSME_00007646 [Camellia sinensis var. sinensis]